MISSKHLSHFAILAFFILVISGYAQTRYVNPIFELKKTTAILFSTNVPQPLFSEATALFPENSNVKEHETTLVDLYMDLYEGDQDVVQDRAAIVLCFGGGFTNGARNLGDIQTLAANFAKKGYVVAAIDYRIGINVSDSGASQRALYRGVQDSRAAIRFLRAHAEEYRIDADKIYIAGPSAGGMIAVHNNYLDESERTIGTRATSYWYSSDGIATASTFELPDLGCLDCAGAYQEFSGKANAVVAFAGALGDLSFIDGVSNAPSLLFHSTDDAIIPYQCGIPFGGNQTALTKVYGSGAIAEGAARKEAPVILVSFADKGHNVHTLDGTMIYPAVMTKMTDFLLPLASEGDLTLSHTALGKEHKPYLFPNPMLAGQSAFLSFSSSAHESIQMQIFDMKGTIMYQKKIMPHAISKDVLSLKADIFQNIGMYIVALKTGNKQYIQRMVVLP